MTEFAGDIQEDSILRLSPVLLNILLKDHTLSTEDKQINIFWATDNYADRGEGFQYNDQITIESITGENGDVIVPRALKSRETQQQRSREMAVYCLYHFMEYLANGWIERRYPRNLRRTPHCRS